MLTPTAHSIRFRKDYDKYATHEYLQLGTSQKVELLEKLVGEDQSSWQETRLEQILTAFKCKYGRVRANPRSFTY